jgi:hypothetical protein
VSPISSALRNSLQNLDHQIEAAEELIAGLPGSRSDSCRIDLPADVSDGVAGIAAAAVSAAMNKKQLGLKEGKIGVWEHSLMGLVTHQGSFKPLSEFRIAERVKLGKRIPELIDQANILEAEVLDSVDEVADTIQQAVAEAAERPDNIEMAEDEFRKWIRRLRGKPARNVQSGDTDPIQREKVTVQPDEAIARFIKMNPRWSKYAAELHDRNTDPFSLLKELWERNPSYAT